MRALIVAVCLTLPACDEDPARSVKIIARPPWPKDEAANLEHSIAPPWRSELCPPPAETSKGEGTFTATGACSFEQTAPVNCLPLGDDFFVELSRPSAHGAMLRIFLNVERYKGPGKYDGNSLLVSVRVGDQVFPWNGSEMTMTVDEGEHFVHVEPAVLPPGFMRNSGPISVSGTLSCKAISDRRQR